MKNLQNQTRTKQQQQQQQQEKLVCKDECENWK